QCADASDEEHRLRQRLSLRARRRRRVCGGRALPPRQHATRYVLRADGTRARSADSRTIGGIARTRSQRAETGRRRPEELTPTTRARAAKDRKPSARLPPCSISICCGTIFKPLEQA